jgi:hypothetical protein
MFEDSKSRAYAVAFLLFVVAAGLILYKVGYLGCAVTAAEPEDGWSVRLTMAFEGRGRDISIQVTLPEKLNERQEITHETQTGSTLAHAVSPDRIGTWQGSRVQGKHTIVYSFLARTADKQFLLKNGLQIPDRYPEDLQEYLLPTTEIQSQDPFIKAKAEAVAADAPDLKQAIRRLHDFVRRRIQYKKPSGLSDALTALRSMKASCTGKSRAFVALCRSRGIPARMVKGLLLQTGKKRATHAWAEVWIEDRWVPFCPTNGYFARIPAKYLELYKGDRRFTRHTKNISFDWLWTIREHLSDPKDAIVSNMDRPLNPLRKWRSSKGGHMSSELLVIILMIPAGATVVAFFRSMIGVTTLGTFMPVLIAVAFRDTGLGWGLILLCIVVLVGLGGRALLQNLHLLQIPRLVVVLTLVIATILGIALFGTEKAIPQAAAVGMFPLVIMTMTVERICVNLLEEGLAITLLRFAVTVGVASLAFLVMNNSLLQSLVLGFPETLLIIVALNILMGTYNGLRLLELYRFRNIQGKRKAGA